MSQILNDDRENAAVNSQTIENCAICLDVIAKKNKSFVDMCLHQYCFDCLRKWCEVKAECPLCKRKIERIIHSVESLRTYKEFIPPDAGPTTSSTYYSLALQSSPVIRQTVRFPTVRLVTFFGLPGDDASDIESDSSESTEPSPSSVISTSSETDERNG